jgi:nicotinate dehydrogenase subunit B
VIAAPPNWASDPILTFPEIREVEIDLIDRPHEKPWGVGEPAAPWSPPRSRTPCGMRRVRLRSVPFTPEKVLAALQRA